MKISELPSALFINIEILYITPTCWTLMFNFIIVGIIENKKIMAYIKKNTHCEKSKISMDEFRTFMEKLKEFKKVISKFETKNKVINYLIKKTNLKKQ